MNLNSEEYDFRFGPGHIKQEDPIISIIEGRLVPRDLSEFEEIGESKENAYMYVDVDGTPKKVSALDLSSGIKVVEEEPRTGDDGQLIFLKIGENKYLAKQRINGVWQDMALKSDADIVSFIPTERLKSSTVQKAIEEVDNKVADIKSGSVFSVNNMVGKIEVKSTDPNVKVLSNDGTIAISAAALATDAEVSAINVDLQAHKSDINNPHQVTKAQVGLSEVDNTSDINKPLSAVASQKFDSLDVEDARLQAEINKKENRITLDNKLKYNLLEGIKEDIIVTKDIGGYYAKDVIPAGTSLFDIINQLLHPEVPVGESYLYYYVGNEIPTSIDSSWVKEKCDGTIISTGATHYYTTNKQYIAFAYPHNYDVLKHIYQNDLTMFDLLPDFSKREVSVDGEAYDMYYVTEKLQGENDKYDFLWS